MTGTEAQCTRVRTASVQRGHKARRARIDARGLLHVSRRGQIGAGRRGSGV